MALGDVRRKMRMLALTNAATMIANYLSSGITADELGLTDDEYDILSEENDKVAERLNLMAEKLEK